MYLNKNSKQICKMYECFIFINGLKLLTKMLIFFDITIMLVTVTYISVKILHLSYSSIWMSEHIFNLYGGLKLMTKMLSFQYNYHIVTVINKFESKFIYNCHILAKCMIASTFDFNEGLKLVIEMHICLL